MSSQPDLAVHFAAMEALVEAQPEGVNAEIARGVYLMSPRPSLAHTFTEGRTFALLDEGFGRGRGSDPPDWLFSIEPEIRSEPAFSRVIPDVAGWRRSTTGWPDLEVNPILLAPDWVAEVLSPHTTAFDRGPKKEAYGLIGVGWLWLIDVKKRRVETFANVRGKMIAGPSLEPGETLSASPFESLTAPVETLFLP